MLEGRDQAVDVVRAALALLRCALAEDDEGSDAITESFDDPKDLIAALLALLELLGVDRDGDLSTFDLRLAWLQKRPIGPLAL